MSVVDDQGWRPASLPPSVLHAVHSQVERAERHGRRVLRLHVGEPALRPPAGVRTAITEAMARGSTGYTSAEGLPVLRERLVDHLARANQVSTTPDRVLVTPGSSYALAAIMLAVCHPGDEVLLPEVFWPIYAQAAAVARASVRTYPLGADYRIDPDDLVRAATTSTRLIIVNSPANPTGALCDPSVLSEIVDRARRRNIWLVGDEAYEHFVYEGRHVALASFERDVPPDERRVFSVHTFSKGFAMTGYRMGYVATPTEEIGTTLRRVCEGTIIAPSTPVQYGALAALEDEDMPRRARAHVRATRDAALTPAVHAGLLDRLPPAGWYALLDVSATGLSSATFAERLLAEEQVAVAPGSTFVSSAAPDPCSVRVAFCGDREATVEGVRRLLRFTADLRADAGDRVSR